MGVEYSYSFTETAVQDFDKILQYISVDLSNPVAAKNLSKKIFERIDGVRTFPDAGSPVDNELLSDKSVRKLSADNYIIYYKAYHDIKLITVIRIVYGKRNLDEILQTI